MAAGDLYFNTHRVRIVWTDEIDDPTYLPIKVEFDIVKSTQFFLELESAIRVRKFLLLSINKAGWMKEYDCRYLMKAENQWAEDV